MHLPATKVYRFDWIAVLESGYSQQTEKFDFEMTKAKDVGEIRVLSAIVYESADGWGLLYNFEPGAFVVPASRRINGFNHFFHKNAVDEFDPDLERKNFAYMLQIINDAFRPVTAKSGTTQLKSTTSNDGATVCRATYHSARTSSQIIAINPDMSRDDLVIVSKMHDIWKLFENVERRK